MKSKLLRNMALTALVGIFIGTSAFCEVHKVSDEEGRRWLRHLIPLPHEISISEKALVECARVHITMADNAGDIERNAASDIRTLLGEEADSASGGNDFEIVMGVADADGKVCGKRVDALKKLDEVRNREQAYVIEPAGDSKLVLAALNPRGLHYAAVTLRALLKPVTDKSKTAIPLMTVIDWPDFDERGAWNQNVDEIMLGHGASLKLNYGNMVQTKLHNISKDGNHAEIDKELMKKGKRKAIHFLPCITHLNFLHYKGLYEVYPELKGKGDSAIAGQYHAHKSEGVQKEHRAPCASNPLLTKILTEWLMDIAAAGAPECSCWLTERPAQCGCDKCMAEGQFVQEARAFINAWKEVKKRYPDFVIRLFISTATNEKYEKILAQLPKGVKIERACAMGLERGSSEPRDIFVNERIDPCAAKGLWVATYDVPITANGKVEAPEFKLPESSACRIHDFVKQMAGRKYSGLYGMLAFSDSEEICGFNIAALGEWAWNVNGRTDTEFAAAWATVNGYSNPDAVAEWSDLMGPVEFDVYDSGFPECYAWNQAVEMIERKKKPECGKGMFRYYADEDSFDKKIVACEKALGIAKKFKDPYLANETGVVLSYAKMAKYIYLIADQVSSGAKKADVSGNLAHLKQAGQENTAAIRQWQEQLGPEPWHHRTYKAIEATEATVSGIAAATGQ